MKSLTILGFLCALFWDRKVTDGFSTVQRRSLERTKQVELSSVFRQLSNSRKPPTFCTSDLLHRNLRLSSAAKSEESDDKADALDDELDAGIDKKLLGRKKRLQMGYLFASMSYLTSALVTIAVYGRFSTKAFYFVFGGGKVNVALILYILKGAASHDRLNSDTYKRLNIAVILYAFSQLLLPTEHMMGLLGRLSFQVPGFLALVNGIKGYGYGCLGWDKSKDNSTILTDFKEGIQSTLKGMTVIKAKSAGYMFATLLLGSMFCFKFKDLVGILAFPNSETATSFLIFNHLSKLARFGMLTTIMYTLKDASDRGRLSGTTFVQLNLLAAAAFLSIALYLLPSIGTFSANSQLLIVGALCVMTLSKGLVNMKPKKE
mmetsp:Transcript_21864/g.52014  ORF Transcript_21864/g.52014 Transcript_21864/m.52014 type:complete len:375 (+) Transcript_21864:238-1362(+)